jgi:hypothetical protein
MVKASAISVRHDERPWSDGCGEPDLRTVGRRYSLGTAYWFGSSPAFNDFAHTLFPWMILSGQENCMNIRSRERRDVGRGPFLSLFLLR